MHPTELKWIENPKYTVNRKSMFFSKSPKKIFSSQILPQNVPTAVNFMRGAVTSCAARVRHERAGNDIKMTLK